MKSKLVLSILSVFWIFGIQAQTLIPPADLKAQHILDDPNVSLTWWEPGTPNWLHYDNGENASNIGTNEEAIFDVAIKYEPDQLIPFNGMSLTQLAFVPAESAASYAIRIWMGDDADSLIYEQEVGGLSMNAWNTIDLDSAIVIDAQNSYYFGYYVNTTGGYPAGCDAGPAVAPGKCDLIRMENGVFESLYAYGLDLNFNIQVYLVPTEAKGLNIKAIAYNDAYNVKPLQINKVSTKFPVSFKRANKSGLADSYNVYRNDVLVDNVVENNYEDVLTDGGIFNYHVTAVYAEQESDKSNTVEVLFDNARILPNTIIAEAMINVGGGSAGSPGAYMGMYEMNYEFEKFAPIIYHNATEILGPDPYSNADSEERFMEYFLLTGAYPMALFQGMALAGGGSNESLYEYYRGAYESVLDIKTPLSFDMQVSKGEGNKYNVSVESKVVGVYQELDLKLHVVLTESNIDHSWDNGNIDQVTFVARGMFPDYNGTMLNFVGDSVAKSTVEIEVDPFTNKENYNVVAFIQHPDYYSILNGDIKPLPLNKNVTFTIVNENNDTPIEGATLVIGDESKTSDESGNVVFGILDNVGEVSYSINHDDFYEKTGVFAIDTTESIVVQLEPSVGVTDTYINTVSIYPNPATNELTIAIEEPENLEICDISGKIVLNTGIIEGRKSIDISMLEQGVYIIKGKTHMVKLLKN